MIRKYPPKIQTLAISWNLEFSTNIEAGKIEILRCTVHKDPSAGQCLRVSDIPPVKGSWMMCVDDSTIFYTDLPIRVK